MKNKSVTYSDLLESSGANQAVIRWSKRQPAKTNLRLLDSQIKPGTRKDVKWKSPGKSKLKTSLVIINGSRPGPRLCLTAAIHGDELNGVEVIRQILENLNPKTLHGTVVAVPIVNYAGYDDGARYVTDQCDLNRCFPGSSVGPKTTRFAHALFTDVICQCDALVDLHTGPRDRTNHPQLRADLAVSGVGRMSAGFGSLSVVQSTAPSGSLREAATTEGIPALVMEIGSSRSLELDKVMVGVNGVRYLLHGSGMISEQLHHHETQHVYHGGGWIRAETDGLLINKVKLGTVVGEGEFLAEIIEPLKSIIHRVVAPCNCTILGRAHNQHVKSGSNLFKVGIE